MSFLFLVVDVSVHVHHQFCAVENLPFQFEWCARFCSSTIEDVSDNDQPHFPRNPKQGLHRCSRAVDIEAMVDGGEVQEKLEVK